MAQTAAPTGAQAILPILSMHTYFSGATKIYPGDFVSILAGGRLVPSTAGAVEMVGVAMGYSAAAGNAVLVSDATNQQYYIQDDGVSATLAATDVGLNADIIATVGNTTFLASRMAIDTDSKQTTTLNFRILGKHPDDTWAKYVRVRGVINEHAFGKKTTGI